MSDDIEKIREELEEVRKLKEELRREVDAVRRDKDETQRGRDEARRHKEETRERRTTTRPRPPRPPRVPRVPRLARLDLDFEGLTDSLETMMDGLGSQIEKSLKSVEGLKVPGIRIHKGRRRTKKRKKQQAMIESIAPERVAKIVAPLGSEERLRLLDYLKTGGKSFKDIENHTGKAGSSLTHHLNPLVEAGYVVKGEVRGTYYVTVEGRLAYRLAQWLTHRVERQRKQTGNNGDTEVAVEFADDESAMEAAEEHLEKLADELEERRDDIEDHREAIEEVKENLEEQREELEEVREEKEDKDDDTEDLDDLDWKD